MGLRFTPTRPLDPSTRYTIHVGGGMTDQGGGLVDLDLHGPMLGGMWVTEEMVMGMNTMGMGMGVSHSRPEWRYVNGMYGLAFAFTTGAEPRKRVQPPKKPLPRVEFGASAAPVSADS
jgi:hypothetical protein